jgi:hypothetical protein
MAALASAASIEIERAEHERRGYAYPPPYPTYSYPPPPGYPLGPYVPEQEERFATSQVRRRQPSSSAGSAAHRGSIHSPPMSNAEESAAAFHQAYGHSPRHMYSPYPTTVRTADVSGPGSSASHSPRSGDEAPMGASGRRAGGLSEDDEVGPSSATTPAYTPSTSPIFGPMKDLMLSRPVSRLPSPQQHDLAHGGHAHRSYRERTHPYASASAEHAHQAHRDHVMHQNSPSPPHHGLESTRPSLHHLDELSSKPPELVGRGGTSSSRSSLYIASHPTTPSATTAHQHAGEFFNLPDPASLHGGKAHHGTFEDILNAAGVTGGIGGSDTGFPGGWAGRRETASAPASRHNSPPTSPKRTHHRGAGGGGYGRRTGGGAATSASHDNLVSLSSSSAYYSYGAPAAAQHRPGGFGSGFGGGFGMTPISSAGTATGTGPGASSTTTPSASTSPAQYATALPTERRRKGVLIVGSSAEASGESDEEGGVHDGAGREAGGEDEEMVTLPPLNLPRSALEKLGREKRRMQQHEEEEEEEEDSMNVDGLEEEADVKVRPAPAV